MATTTLGRRAFKKAGGDTRWFVYDGWNMVGEYLQTTGDPALGRRYVWGLDLAGQENN